MEDLSIGDTINYNEEDASAAIHGEGISEVIESNELNVDNQPSIGMSFPTLDDLCNFYQTYAKSKGFSVNKISGRKDGNGNGYQFITIGCHRGRKAGNNSKFGERQRPSSRICCKARVCASAQCDGRWRINKVILEHNHDMTPSKSRFLQKHREVPAHVKRRLEVNDNAGIRPCKTFRCLVTEAGGYEAMSCLERDCRNHLGKVRRLQLQKGDAESVHQLFRRMQQRDPNFFYEIAVDKEGRMKNIFWADARSQEAYKEFGDVVSLDTTYLLNRYQMPFAPFVGINHHGQSILLGCALVCNEKVKTFVWVFKQWLRCMGNVPPPAIITDQCLSIAKGIEIVFPEARHRWCLWHIMSKFPEKMKHYKQYYDIKDLFQQVVYDSVSIEEFTNGWASLLVIYELEDNTWLNDLYDGREKWAPIFVRRDFWGGMSSTQRSESMNSFFDGYIHSRSSLKQFVDQYEVALIDKIEKETQADFASMNTQIPTFSKYPIEKQFLNAYTNDIFLQVKNEFINMVYCTISLVEEEGKKYLYRVNRIVYLDDNRSKRIDYDVTFDKNLVEVKCNCLLFESKGILCCHALSVVKEHDVKALPPRYILKRWRKDVKRCHSKIGSSIFGKELSMEARRVKELEDIFMIAADIAYDKEDRFSYMYGELNKMVKKLQNWEPDQQCINNDPHSMVVQPASCVGSSVVGGNEAAPIGYNDPITTKCRGRPKSNRQAGKTEKHVKQAKKKQKKTKPCEFNKNSAIAFELGIEAQDLAGPSHSIMSAHFIPEETSVSEDGLLGLREMSVGMVDLLRSMGGIP